MIRIKDRSGRGRIKSPEHQIGWKAGILFRMREQLIDAKLNRDWLSFNAGQEAAAKVAEDLDKLIRFWRA